MNPTFRKSRFALAFLGLLLSAAPIFADPVAVDAKTVVTAPNWVLGSTWYYSDGYALKVSSATPGATVFDRLDAPGQWFSRQGFLRKDLTSGTATRTSIFRTVPDQAGMTLRAGNPLTFQREYLENGVLMVHASSWSVEGRETVTVPAGTFDCWVIVWRSRSLRSDWTGFERWWYSPQAQNYVRMEYKYGSDAEGSRVLMRYQIGAQAAENTTTQPVTPAVPAPVPAKTASVEPAALPPVLTPPEPRETASVTDARRVSEEPTPDEVVDPVHSVPTSAAAIRTSARHAGTSPAAPALVQSADEGAAPAHGGTVWHAQVASSKEEAAVRKSLDKVLLGRADVLKDVSSGITAARVGSRGLFYRAWLGEFDRSAEATALCSALRSGGTACSVSKSGRAQSQKLASDL